MKYYTGFSFFKYSWDQVVSTFFQRYPNPRSKHVLTEDTICHYVKDKRLFTRKLYSKTNKLPRWGEIFVSGPKHIYIVEESIVDPIAKTLTTYTRNIGYLKTVMVVEEKCEYSLAEDNKKMTSIKREAWVSSGIYGFSQAISAFGVERYKKNACNSEKGLLYALERVHSPDKGKELTATERKLKETAKSASSKAKDMAAKAGIIQ
ncbi:PRELI domain-containing protein 1, mitochondrial-like [Ptychodera flava]|uniref:PRELI domain-containing protein 1, mitochondrial-like n=1 Tax=Ptychodera flava TaxID=63121 RepID=UPI00396A6220